MTLELPLSVVEAARFPRGRFAHWAHLPNSDCKMSVSASLGRLLTGANHDSREIKTVRGTLASGVLIEARRTTLEEPGSADAVSAGGVREADTELRQALPKVAFVDGPGLPARLQHLMGSKGSSLPHQTTGRVQRLQRRQRFFRNWLNAGSPVRQWSAKSITRPLLARAPGIVPVAVRDHIGLLASTHRR